VNDGLEDALIETGAYYYKDISFKFPGGNEKKNYIYRSK
jgi:hypothetical protein